MPNNLVIDEVENNGGFTLNPIEGSETNAYTDIVEMINSNQSYEDIREVLNTAIAKKLITEDEHFKLQAILGARERSRR